MGTSKSYSAYIKGQPQWGSLSGTVTGNCNGGIISKTNLGKILSKYVTVIGGASKAGRGQSRIAGKSGIRTAIKLSHFLDTFNSSGGDLKFALGETKIIDLSNKSISDIVDHLIEYLSGPASTIDDKAAKEASRKLLEELTLGAGTVDDLQVILKETLDKESLEEIMIKYFGYYILEHLSIMFYEKLLSEKGKSNCNDLFRQIKEFIVERLKEMNRNNPLKGLDWGGNDAERIIKNIQQDVLTVFEKHEDEN